MKTDIIILAAGKGTRMKSERPKVLTPVGGKTIISHLIDAVSSICSNPILVVGHKAEEVVAAVGSAARFVRQTEQKGTGHAVRAVFETPEIASTLKPSLIVTPGDHPLVRPGTFASIVEKREKTGAALVLGTLTVPNFDGIYSVFNHYGRVIRDKNGKLVAIREYKDATEEERAIREVNPSYYCFDSKWLARAIKNIGNNNASREFYLTDAVGIATAEGAPIETISLSDYSEALGINTPEQQSMIETTFFSPALA